MAHHHSHYSLTRHSKHHRLPAAAPSASQGPPGNAGPATVQAVQNSTQRLAEMFDMIKQEFETIGQDANAYRGQRDEYESKCESGLAAWSRQSKRGCCERVGGAGHGQATPSRRRGRHWSASPKLDYLITGSCYIVASEMFWPKRRHVLSHGFDLRTLKRLCLTRQQQKLSSFHFVQTLTPQSPIKSKNSP